MVGGDPGFAWFPIIGRSLSDSGLVGFFTWSVSRASQGRLQQEAVAA